jgi:hypothetical protein
MVHGPGGAKSHHAGYQCCVTPAVNTTRCKQQAPPSRLQAASMRPSAVHHQCRLVRNSWKLYRALNALSTAAVEPPANNAAIPIRKGMYNALYTNKSKQAFACQRASHLLWRAALTAPRKPTFLHDPHDPQLLSQHSVESRATR